MLGTLNQEEIKDINTKIILVDSNNRTASPVASVSVVMVPVPVF